MIIPEPTEAELEALRAFLSSRDRNVSRGQGHSEGEGH